MARIFSRHIPIVFLPASEKKLGMRSCNIWKLVNFVRASPVNTMSTGVLLSHRSDVAGYQSIWAEHGKYLYITITNKAVFKIQAVLL